MCTSRQIPSGTCGRYRHRTGYAREARTTQRHRPGDAVGGRWVDLNGHTRGRRLLRVGRVRRRHPGRVGPRAAVRVAYRRTAGRCAVPEGPAIRVRGCPARRLAKRPDNDSVIRSPHRKARDGTAKRPAGDLPACAKRSAAGRTGVLAASPPRERRRLAGRGGHPPSASPGGRIGAGLPALNSRNKTRNHYSFIYFLPRSRERTHHSSRAR